MTQTTEGQCGALETVGERVRDLRARFEAEIEPLRRPLWQYCQRLTGSPFDAEDLVQKTLQRGLARLANLWQAVDPRAYLFRIATNAWIDRRRKDVRAELEELTAELPAPDPSPELRVEAREAMAHLVAVLTPLQRVVFLLCDTLDFRAPEAAALLAVTEGAVKAALHRARRALAARPKPSARPRAEVRGPRETDETVQRYIEAFDARDPDALAALLHPEAVTTIVGTAEELGREATRQGSLAEWAAEPVPQWVRPGLLADREVLFVLAPGEDGEPALYSMIELETEAGAVTAQRIYFYSADLLEHAADALGIRALTHGYRYEGSIQA